MPDIMYKTFRTEVKAVNSEDGTIDMLIPMSTASIDRDGESIDPLGWRKSLPAFRKRPVLLSSHNYGDLRKQIGEFTQIKVSEDGLFAKPKYYINEGNDEADWAFKLASKGMAAFSVGFMPKAWVDGDGEKTPARTYTEQELLEISHVVVPSNRDAIQGLRGKSADPAINQLVEDIINAEIVDMTDHEKKPWSQAEIKDELDFVKTMLAELESFDEENQKMAKELMERITELMRTPGSDMPAEDKPVAHPFEEQAIDDDRLKAIINQTVSHVINHI